MEREDDTRSLKEQEGIATRANVASYKDVFANCQRGDIRYDNWLNSFGDEITERIEICDTPIIDLGCDSGNNTLYLIEKGKKNIIPCDFSLAAIQSINRNFPELENDFAKHFDMTNRFPFKNNFTDLIICDLALHYFTEETTFRVLDEIKRVLRPNGILLARVNTMEDYKYGAGQGTEIEHHLYQKNGRFKRFFDEDDIKKFFEDWEQKVIKEGTMSRYRR